MRGFNRLVQLVKELPADMFINRILLDYSQCEVNLEKTRAMLFDITREADDFPFDRDADLKRRLNTRVGESVSVKLANDIYKLLTVIEGSDYSELRDMISSGVSRGRTRARSISRIRSSSYSGNLATSGSAKQSGRPASQVRPGAASVQDSLVRPVVHECHEQIKNLTCTMSGLQAEILLMKQRQIAIENSRSDQMKTFKTAITSIRSELKSLFDTVTDKTTEINNTMLCIEKQQLDKIGHLKTKILENSNTIVHVQEQCLHVISAQVAALSMTDSPPLPAAAQSSASAIGVSLSQTSALQLGPAGDDPSFSEQLSAFCDQQSDTSVKYTERETEIIPFSPSVAPGSAPGPLIVVERIDSSQIDALSNAVAEKGNGSCESPNLSSMGLGPVSGVADMENGLSFGNLPIPKMGAQSFNNKKGQQGHTAQRNVCFADIIAQIGTPSSPKAISKCKNRSNMDRPIKVRITERNPAGSSKSFIKPKQTLVRISTNSNDSSCTNETFDDDFENYVRKRTKCFYVGGILPSIPEDMITTFVTEKGLSVTKVSIFRNKRLGTAFARLNIVNSSEASRVLDPDFWPRGVSCRPWLSYNAYRRNQQSRLPRSSNIHTASVDRNDSSSDYTSGISADSWRSSGACSDKGSYDTQWDIGDLADYNLYTALD